MLILDQTKDLDLPKDLKFMEQQLIDNLKLKEFLLLKIQDSDLELNLNLSKDQFKKCQDNKRLYQ